MTIMQPPGNLRAPSRYPVGSSEWWIERLSGALQSRLDRFKKLESYFRGTQDLQHLAGQAWMESDLRRAFPKYLHANHSKLIVNAATQRLRVLGFRMAGELRADTEAARIWRANEMESESRKAHTESLVKSECPVLVEPNPRDPATPIITPQDPSQVIVWHAAGDRRIRLAALKTWWDYDVRRRVYLLYLPDRIERWQDRETGQMDWWMNRLFGSEPPAWEMRAAPNRAARVENPLGEVPIVVIPNDPRLSGSPEAEHEAVLSRIDHYNKTLMNMAVTSNEMAYPQRWGTGVEPGEPEPLLDPITGEPVIDPTTGEPYPKPQHQGGQTRWITTPTPDAQFGQFLQAELSNYVKELEVIRADIATETFTPYHFLLNMPTSVPPSGQSIVATETPLVDKVKAHQEVKGVGWREVMRLGFLLAGDPQRAAAIMAGSVVWEDAERRTEAQHIDALGKLRKMLELPRDAVWEMIPATPEQIERWTAMLAEPGQALPQPTASVQNDSVEEPEFSDVPTE